MLCRRHHTGHPAGALLHFRCRPENVNALDQITGTSRCLRSRFRLLGIRCGIKGCLGFRACVSVSALENFGMINIGASIITYTIFGGSLL